MSWTYMQTFSFIPLMASEKKIFYIIFFIFCENLAFRLPWQPIIISENLPFMLPWQAVNLWFGQISYES